MADFREKANFFKVFGFKLNDQGSFYNKKNECLVLSLAFLMKIVVKVVYPKTTLSFILREKHNSRAEDTFFDTEFVATDCIAKAYECVAELQNFVTIVLSYQSNNVDIFAPDLKGRNIDDLPVLIIWHELAHYIPLSGPTTTFGMFKSIIKRTELRMCPIVFSGLSTSRQLRVLDKLARVKPLMI